MPKAGRRLEARLHRSPKDNVRLLERMVMTIRPDGRQHSYVFELLHHELQRTVESLERGSSPDPE